MPDRLLFIIGKLDIGGAERHLLQVLPQLQSRGFRIAVYTIGQEGIMAADFRSAGVPVFSPPMADSFRKLPFPLGKSLLFLVSVFRLFTLFLFYRPVLVHFFLPEAYLVGGMISLLFPGLRRVMSRRSLDHYQKRYPLGSRVERWLHPRMDVVLGNSRSVIRQLENEGVKREQLGLIYNGLDTTVFDVPFDRMHARAGLGLSSDDLVMVLVANLISYKGHDDLLTVLGMIKDRLPENWVLLCVGRDDGIGELLEAKVQELSISSHIIWMGMRHDVEQLLRLSDIGLMCSHQEGFSNAVLEGMAAGLPMLVTDVGGNREAVIHGVTGYVVPPEDHRMFGESLFNLATDPVLRQRLGEAGRDRMNKNFTLDSCVNKYELLYRSVIKGAKIPALDEIGSQPSSN